MNAFRRVVRFILFLAGLVAGLVVALAAFVSRYMIRPPRQRLWATPRDAGMDFEDVEFPARDGLRLSGWFIPVTGDEMTKKPTILLVHGWPWNRLGEAADSFLANVSGGLPVDLLRLAHALHQAELNVLMFDLRNHGKSADGGPVTFGLQESNDILGALDYLASRADVDEARIGTVGFSMGANALLFALPHAERIRAAVAVQPTSPSLFSRRFASDLLGPLGSPVLALTDFIYSKVGHLPISAIEPMMAAAGAGDTPVLYVQGRGDHWGSVSNVAQMVEKTPNAVDPLFVDTNHRFGGYRYVVQNPEVLTAFFAQHFR